MKATTQEIVTFLTKKYAEYISLLEERIMSQTPADYKTLLVREACSPQFPEFMEFLASDNKRDFMLGQQGDD